VITACRHCGGARTAWWGMGTTWYACMRCDTDERGGGNGPPRFKRVWDERRKDLQARSEGSEER
jgi:hypothetical protein